MRWLLICGALLGCTNKDGVSVGMMHERSAVYDLHDADSPIVEWRDAEHHVTCWTRVGEAHGEVAISCLRDESVRDGGVR